MNIQWGIPNVLPKSVYILYNSVGQTFVFGHTPVLYDLIQNMHNEESFKQRSIQPLNLVS